MLITIMYREMEGGRVKKNIKGALKRGKTGLFEVFMTLHSEVSYSWKLLANKARVGSCGRMKQTRNQKQCITNHSKASLTASNSLYSKSSGFACPI